MPSENVAASTSPPDRRTRKRAARRDALLEIAADLVAQDGVAGVTMAALAEAADYAPASLYTYFPSRSALLAALQQRALDVLARVANDAVERWDAALARRPVTDPVATLARLWAFSDLFLTAPEHHPREFRLQQELLVTPGAEDTADAASVVPTAMVVLEVPRHLLHSAAERGALEPGDPLVDPVGSPIDPALARTFAWVVALNGALLVDGLRTGLPSTGPALGTELTGSLLRGWGAAPDDLRAARAIAQSLPTARDEPSAAPTRRPTTDGGPR